MTARLWPILVTVLVLAALAVGVARTVRVDTDLSFFMPDARTPEVQALTQGFDRAGSLVMLRLDGAPAERMAAASDAVVERLGTEPGFALLRNGRPRLPAAMRGFVMDHRFLIGPDPPADAFTTARLETAIADGIAALSTTAGWALRELFPRDPTGRFRAVLESLGPGQAMDAGPERRHGVWMDDAERALILIWLSAPSSDVPAQRAARAAIETAVDEARRDLDLSTLRHVASGPGFFALDAGARIRSDMQRLTIFASLAVAALLLLAFRGPRILVLVGLPVGFGVLAGMAVTQALFGGVHGVAIAFGAVLSGVAADYPIHLLGHRRAGETPGATARRLRRAMAIGAATTIAGLTALIPSSFPGLAQIGTLAATGMVVAFAVSQGLLPSLMPDRPSAPAERGAAAVMARLRRAPAARRAGAGLLAVLFAGLVLVAWTREAPVWERDLRALSVSDPEARALDGRLRAALGLPDVRRILLVEGPDAETVLTRQRALFADLDAAVADGRLGGYRAAARLLPPTAEQRARQQAMPDAGTLRRRLAEATADLPVTAGTFDPFVADIARHRDFDPLDPAAMREGPIAPLFLAPWALADGGWAGAVALVPPIPADLAALPGLDGGRAVDLAAVAGGIVTRYRDEALGLLGIGLLAGLGLLTLGLRRPGRILRAAAPPIGAIAITVALLLAAGVSLTLFHLLALLLIASLGIDYALFFPGYGDDKSNAAAGFRSVGLCCLTSTVVFATLALSSIPVLSAIGLTVAVGTVISFALTLCLAGQEGLS